MQQINKMSSDILRLSNHIKKLPEIIAKQALKDVLDTFEQKGYYEGNTFKKWVESYPSVAKRKYKYTYKDTTLVHTGALKKSIHYEIDKNRVRLGTNISYAKQNNEGSNSSWSFNYRKINIKGQRIYRRTFLYLRTENINKKINEHLNKIK